jgi:dTDP-4-amino-4,6-dideoxygalactose transaminase
MGTDMFEVVEDFEMQIAEFFKAPFAVAVDSCTHGIELALRYTGVNKISVPKRTYISIPLLAQKLGIELEWRDEIWVDYYHLTASVIDAAVLWRADSYIPGTMMALSFQYQKHLSLGRGGMLLLDDENAALELKKMSYDGRVPSIPWREQDISTVGYHYYMTPETALLGSEKLPAAMEMEPRKWVAEDWPDLTNMSVFRREINR